MSFTITKEIRFEAAHRLADGYKGKCAHLHGHSWVAKVSLEGLELDAVGMLVDFGALTPLRVWADNTLDHAVLVNQSDNTLVEWCVSEKQKHLVVNGNPTSENLAKLIFEKTRELGFPAKEVSIAETCTCTAVYRHE